MKPLVKKRQEEVHISGTDMAELISAVHEKGAVFRFKATGVSMRPSIRNNDMLTISPLKGLLPVPGEVVAFRHPQSNRLILHRVVKKKGNFYFIRGDSLRLADANIPEENIIGVVIRVERGGRAVFWPDRFSHSLLSGFYFRTYLVYLFMRRVLKNILKKLFRKNNSKNKIQDDS